MRQRPRRLRCSESTRNFVEQYKVTNHDLMAPFFLLEGTQKKVPVDSMPGQFRFSLDLLLEELKELVSLGLQGIALFPCLSDESKDKRATLSHDSNHFYQKAIREIKNHFPKLIVMTDVAMDPYSSDGHDGLVSADGEILNDETLDILCKMAVTQAQSGADWIGPSDMMDGRVAAIREALDQAGFESTIIISYTAKYASSFYGPFRDALDSQPKAGDKKSYQMNYANRSSAMRELSLDEKEGADIVMVKPGLSYLDIIRDFKERTILPIAAYNVSGEYAMVKAAHHQGYINGPQVMEETLCSFKRAGADIILTYFAGEYLRGEFY